MLLNSVTLKMKVEATDLFCRQNNGYKRIRKTINKTSMINLITWNPHPSISLPMTDSFCCHLDDRRGLFVRRDFSSRTRRNDSVDATFCHFHIVPNKNWVATQDDSQIERSPRPPYRHGNLVYLTNRYLIKNQLCAN
jgi:hypothetical protein